MAKLPIADFLTARLKEYDPNFDVRKGTGFAQLFINPMQFMLQPLADDAAFLRTAQSFLRILQQDDPDAFDEESVDALAANLFVTRAAGGQSSGVARVYYIDPVDREWPENGIEIQGSNGQVYTNPAPYRVSQADMTPNIENEMYYYDITVISTDVGTSTSLNAYGLVGVDNDPDVITVSNPVAITGGADRETNTELIDRVRRSIAIRDLVTGKGFSATMFDNFIGFLTELTTVGFGDAEMMRDVLYNTHVGGKVDGFFKTANISQGHQNFVGLLPDTTRQAYSSTNIQLTNLDYMETGGGNFDITYDRPIVQQVKAETIARYKSTVDLATAPVNLATNDRIRLSVAGLEKEMSLAGSIPSSTTRSEILNAINRSYGYLVAFAVGNSIELRTSTRGKSAELVISMPEAGTSAMTNVFGLVEPTLPQTGYTFYGDGPLVFTEVTHYVYDTTYGSIARVVGAVKAPLASTGVGTRVAAQTIFTDPTTNVFSDVAVNDIVTVNPNDVNLMHQMDYRVLGKTDNNTLVLDGVLWFRGPWNAETNYPVLADGAGYAGESYKISRAASRDLGSGVISFVVGDYVTYNGSIWVKNKTPLASGISYVVRRTGIKNQETVYVQYWYNPVSIDVGASVKNTDSITGKVTRGVRPGREDKTIRDTAFLRINKIEVIDPLTFEVTGEILGQGGGYGQGGYGEGPYGSGGGSDFRLVVNSPTERFSVYEDSYIVIDPTYIGMSVRVDYDYVPECGAMHDFVLSDYERVLDGDTLMRHLLPAYVSGEIRYKVDSTDSTIPDNDTLTGMVKAYISEVYAGEPLDLSKIKQYIARTTDPYARYGTSIHPFTLTAMIHNTDGTTTVVSSNDTLIVPTPDPFPKWTTHPLSPRITHWIGDNIVLTRET